MYLLMSEEARGRIICGNRAKKRNNKNSKKGKGQVTAKMGRSRIVICLNGV